MYWDKKDFFNINKMRFDEYDKEELFYWFCKNHPKDAPDNLKTSINKINKNILNNEQIFNDIHDNGDFDQIIDLNSKTIFIIEENSQYWNGIFKFYDLYFFYGLEIDTIGPLSLIDALDQHYITQERNNGQLLEIEYDKDEINWEKIQEIMSSNKPSLKSEIIVNNETFVHEKNGLWITKF